VAQEFADNLQTDAIRDQMRSVTVTQIVDAHCWLISLEHLRLPLTISTVTNPAALRACNQGRLSETRLSPPVILPFRPFLFVPGNNGPVAFRGLMMRSNSIAGALSGTCSSLFCFVWWVGFVHTPRVKSNSFHSACNASPAREPVSKSNRKQLAAL
jgi:hypothetical protein